MEATLTRSERRLPQHVLGHDIAEATCLDDALRIAELDWTVSTRATDTITILDDEGVTSTSLPDHRLVLRSDTGMALGAVGSRYKPVSNREAFALADHASQLGATFAYAGETNHGRDTFFTMDIPEARLQVGGHDTIDFGVVLTANHSGNGAIVGKVTANRLICTNGMTSGLNVDNRWSLRHTSSFDEQAAAAQDAMTHAFSWSKAFAAHADALISTKMPTGEFERFLNVLMPKPDEHQSDRVLATWERNRDALLRLFKTAITQEEGRNTAWAGWNAVVEWDQWVRPARDGDEGRALRNFREGRRGLSHRAFELLSA